LSKNPTNNPALWADPALAEQRRRLTLDFKYTLSPVLWLQSIGFRPFDWQRDVFSDPLNRILINGARQAGKSTIVCGFPAWAARFFPGSLSVILAATEKQAIEDMEKIKAMIAMDPDYPEMIRSSDSLLKLSNGSRILVVPATETGARGFSRPFIIVLDEASRIGDIIYTSGVRAMLTDNKNAKLITISTPNGRRGFFARAYKSDRWSRYEVTAPWDLKDGLLLPYTPPERQDGIRRYVSPRHLDREDMEESLDQNAGMGELMFRQEYLVQFVEPEDQVFGYDDIASAFLGAVKPLLNTDIVETVAVQPLRGL
jgi:hypothetical protein